MTTTSIGPRSSSWASISHTSTVAAAGNCRSRARAGPTGVPASAGGVGTPRRRWTVTLSGRRPEASVGETGNDPKEKAVSNLIAVAYEDVGTARNVLGELGELGVEHAITLDDAVIVERRPDGKVKLHQTVKPGAAGAAGGAPWGGLIGLLFLAPFLGMAVGAASGGLAGATTDMGVDDAFMKQLGE